LTGYHVMQNKPNSPDTQTNVVFAKTTRYENNRLRPHPKNKPNLKPRASLTA